MNKNTHRLLRHPTAQALLSASALLLATTVIHAETVGYYIGIDTRNPIASGTYRGLENPNFGRLTFLYAHTYEYVPGLAPAGANTFAVNHYHPIGAYSLSGPTNAVIINPTSTNPRIPEVSSDQPPLTFAISTNALFAGKLVHTRSGEHYSDLRWRATDDLNQPAIYGPGSPEWVLFYSSAGTRTNSLAGGLISLELIRKSEGLHIGSSTALDILTNPGDRFSLGDGPAMQFDPVFWVEANAAVGTYSATFKLVDLNNTGGRRPFLDSGEFSLDFKVAPTPALNIATAVQLSMPIVTPGYILEGAPSVNGPWTAVTLPHGTHSGDQQTVSLPASSAMQVFRLRKP